MADKTWNLSLNSIEEVLNNIDPTDTVFVQNLDDLGKSLREVILNIAKVTESGAELMIEDQEVGAVSHEVLFRLVTWDEERRPKRISTANRGTRGKQRGRPQILTEEIKHEIRARYASGTVSYADLAKDYSVSVSTVIRTIKKIDMISNTL